MDGFFFCFSCVRALAFRVEGRIGWGWISAVHGFVVPVHGDLKRCVGCRCEKKELELHDRSEVSYIYLQPTYIILFSCLSCCLCFCEVDVAYPRALLLVFISTLVRIEHAWL